MDVFATYRRMNLKCELVGESSFEIFQIEHEMVGGIWFNSSESRQQSSPLHGEMLENF